MLTKSSLQLLSEYNQLMNQRMYDCALQLSEHELHKDRGAFFKSIIATFNHILVGDIIWLKRFASHPSSKATLYSISNFDTPKSLDSILYPDLKLLRIERSKVDDTIISWINALSEHHLDDTICYHNMAGIQFKKHFASLIQHLFLHQVHHRGQISTLLSQSGLDFGDTDLLELISAL